MIIKSRGFAGRPTRVTETQFAYESEVENADVYTIMPDKKICLCEDEYRN